MVILRATRTFHSAAKPLKAAALSVAFVSGMSACGGTSSTPTSPTSLSGSGGDIVSLDVLCPTPLLIGERGPCVASARLQSGLTPVVSFDAQWSSARSDIVAVDALGIVRGQAAGQTTISATYRGRTATTAIAVTAEDAIRIRAAAQQGEFVGGSTVTMWLQGYYSVASADPGSLRLRITDQNGVITTTPPTTVVRGGDFFLLSSTFVIPQDSIEVCRTAVLEIAATTIALPQSNESGLWCIPVRR